MITFIEVAGHFINLGTITFIQPLPKGDGLLPGDKDHGVLILFATGNVYRPMLALYDADADSFVAALQTYRMRQRQAR